MIIDKITILGINPYTFFSGIAFLSAFIILTYSLKNYPNEYKYIPRLVIAIIPNILLFGSLTGLTIEIIKIALSGDWSSLKKIYQCGFVAYGGIIGILFTTNRFASKNGLDRILLNDTISYVIPIAHGIARFGCLFAGCCYGKEYHGPFAVYYTDKGIYCFPSQIVEAILNLALGIYLIYLYKQNKNNGRIMYIYLEFYSVYRFLLEFLRGDEFRGVFFNLSSSQYISIIIFIFAFVKLYFHRRKIKIYE